MAYNWGQKEDTKNILILRSFKKNASVLQFKVNYSTSQTKDKQKHLLVLISQYYLSNLQISFVQ